MTFKDIGIGVAIGATIYLMLNGVNLWPLLLVGGLLYFLFLTNPSFTHRRYATVVGPSTCPAVTFDDVGGLAPVKQELKEALDFLTDPEEAMKMGIRPLKGIILSGPPGTGKTLLAKAAANYTDSAFLATSGSEFVEVYAGVGAQRVRSLFKNARETARRNKKKSAIIFIDEMEVLGGWRGKNVGHLEYDQTLNQLLVEMDGLSSADGVTILVMGATNRLDLVDPALLRPGRFDRVIKVGLPDREARRQILDVHVKGKPIAEDVDLDRIAKETFGFSGAHLESLVNEAAILARRAGSAVIKQEHLEEAIEKVVLGEKLERRPRLEERRRVAVHEAGHAIVSEVLRPGSVSSITVSPRSSALGYVRHGGREEDSYIQSRKELEQEMAILLAGAIAEEEILGEGSTGAADDIQKAMQVGKRLVLCGLSPAGFVDPENTPSDVMQRALASLVEAQTRGVRAILERVKSLIVDLAERLLEREVLNGDEARRIIVQYMDREGLLKKEDLRKKEDTEILLQKNDKKEPRPKSTKRSRRPRALRKRMSA